MISRDPEPFNRIANDPDVRPWLLGPEGPLDLSELIRDRANVCFLTPGGDGAYVYLFRMPGLYEVHTLACKSARGRPMLRLMREGLSYMFHDVGADEIITALPDNNPNAERWAMLAGFQKVERYPADAPGHNGIGGWSARLTFARWQAVHGRFEANPLPL